MNTRELRSEPTTFQQHPTASLWVLWLQNRFEGTFPPCHPLFCSVTKRNLNSRSAHQFLRNSRVLMPDNSGALWLSPSPSNLQFIHMLLKSKIHNLFHSFFFSWQNCLQQCATAGPTRSLFELSPSQAAQL